MEVCAAIPPPATTATPATPQVMYLRFFDCRCSDMKDPTPGVYVPGAARDARVLGKM
jgi:hypothetical protein